jgi:hypothetical protein
LLRQIGRHLTAYDLVRFHHAGANYPDALLLDVVLRSTFDLIEQRSALFLDAAADDERTRKAKRLRRRGMRQAWLIRQRYRGHAVPDAPTSPGENTRVLPMPHVRVPEEQILQPHRRSKQLFADGLPSGELGENVQAILRQSVRDLEHPHELRELGMALFLDRPLGAFKLPGEPDQTPLLSYEAFSRSIATQCLFRLNQDKALLPDSELAILQPALTTPTVPGIPVAEVTPHQRLGVVSLADARKVAEDFVFLRTTQGSSTDFLKLFDFWGLVKRFNLQNVLQLPGYLEKPILILGRLTASGEIVLTVYETGTFRARLELSANPRDGYVCRAGVEYPRQGLRVRRVWERTAVLLREHDLTGEELFLRPV